MFVAIKHEVQFLRSPIAYLWAPFPLRRLVNLPRLFHFGLCKDRGNILLISYLRIFLLKVCEEILCGNLLSPILCIQDACIGKCERIPDKLHGFGRYAIL